MALLVLFQDSHFFMKQKNECGGVRHALQGTLHRAQSDLETELNKFALMEMEIGLPTRCYEIFITAPLA